MRIGIFGGSFNPIHQGHLFVAESVLAEFALDRVLFIPAAVSPFKKDQSKVVGDHHRVQMVKIATAPNPRFQTSEIEVLRGGSSFTIDTLKQLSDGWKDAELFLILGGDSLASFPSWHRPEDILDVAQILVYDRPGSASPEGFDFKDRLHVCDIHLPLEISSTDIRSRIVNGKPFRYLVPDMVYNYINEMDLYLDQ